MIFIASFSLFVVLKTANESKPFDALGEYANRGSLSLGLHTAVCERSKRSNILASAVHQTLIRC